MFLYKPAFVTFFDVVSSAFVCCMKMGLVSLVQAALFSVWIQTVWSYTVQDNQTKLLACFLVERGDTNDVYDYDKAAAAVDLAVEWVNDYVLPGNTSLSTLYVDIGSTCTGKSEVMSFALDLWQTDTRCDAYFGPGCGASFQILYDFAEFLNIPVFGLPAASVGIVAPLTEYPLMIRASITHSTLAILLLRFFTHFNYTTPYFLIDTSDSFFRDMGVLLTGAIKEKGSAMYYSCKFVLFESRGLTNSGIERLLEEASKYSRVILLIANSHVTQRIMVNAHDLEMTTGSYVFLAIELFESPVWGKFTWKSSHPSISKITREAYKVLLVLSIQVPADDSLFEYWKNVKQRALDSYNYTYSNPEQVDLVVAHFYDAVYIYAKLVRKLAHQGADYTDGQAVAKMGRNFTFFSVPLNRDVLLDENGDRISTFVMRTLGELSGKYEDLYIYPSTVKAVQVRGKLTWPNGAHLLPPNTPLCGFDGSALICQQVSGMSTRDTLIASVVSIVCGVGLIATAVVWGHHRYVSNQDDPFWWRILIAQVRPPTDADLASALPARTVASSGRKSRMTSITSYKRPTVPTDDHEDTNLSVSGKHPQALFPEHAAPFVVPYLVNGATLGLRRLPEPLQRVTKSTGRELMPLRTLRHNNIQMFVGVVVTEENLCAFIAAEVCSRGNLHTLLSQMKMQLDWTFKFSLLKDLAAGMSALHYSSVKSHGNLTSYCCLIDSQFVLKVSDHGLAFLIQSLEDLEPPQEHEVDRDFSHLLWRAPEHLRHRMPLNGTIKGDVFSFSIIMQQAILRSPPYGHSENEFKNSDAKDNQYKAKEIVMEVKRGGNPLMRPNIPASACSNKLHMLMEHCWEEDLHRRPYFARISNSLAKTSAAMRLSSNIVDTLIRTMEQYAQTLEVQVEGQMRNFMDEKRRSEQILSFILPKPVAVALTRGEKVCPETFQSTTVYFSDVDGFSETIAMTDSPRDVVDILNALYNVFDAIMEEFDVYKVETLNDAYLVVSGLPVPNGHRHAEQIASMALKLSQEIGLFVMGDCGTPCFKLRVGINSGPCVAGVVGLRMPRYCLFGDTVNTAARMETHGKAGRIHCSLEFKDVLDTVAAGQFLMEARGVVHIKGKGNMETFWLLNRVPAVGSFD